tara:strand:- start:1728 stop:2012 length:285 start_codon:yes stop_codon:yes gene_type:complete
MSNDIKVPNVYAPSVSREGLKFCLDGLRDLRGGPKSKDNKFHTSFDGDKLEVRVYSKRPTEPKSSVQVYQAKSPYSGPELHRDAMKHLQRLFPE